MSDVCLSLGTGETRERLVVVRGARGVSLEMRSLGDELAAMMGEVCGMVGLASCDLVCMRMQIYVIWREVPNEW